MLAGIWDVLCGFLFCTLLIANFSELRYYNENPNPRSTHSKWKWLFNWYIFPTCYLIPRGSHLRNWQAMRTPFDFRTNWPVLKSINYWGFFFKQKPNQSWGTTRFLNAHSVVTPLLDIFPTRLHSFVTFVNKDDTYLLLVNNTRLPTSFQQVSQSRVEFYSTNKLLTTIYKHRPVSFHRIWTCDWNQ